MKVLDQSNLSTNVDNKVTDVKFNLFNPKTTTVEIQPNSSSKMLNLIMPELVHNNLHNKDLSLSKTNPHKDPFAMESGIVKGSDESSLSETDDLDNDNLDENTGVKKDNGNKIGLFTTSAATLNLFKSDIKSVVHNPFSITDNQTSSNH